MAYAVFLRPAAQRQVDRLRGATSIAVLGVILALGNEPRPPGASKLTGLRNLWRLRVRIDGRSWRIIYEIDDKAHRVRVTRVVARDEGTYRGL